MSKTKIIPYSCQYIDKKDIKSVTKVLQSNFLTQGPLVKKFENSIKKYVGSKYCISANSATSALHIACLAIGISKNDWVWTSANSFVASANCAAYCGANVDFVDIDDDMNISIDSLEKKLKSTPKVKRPKLLVVVHFAGNPCKMKEIKKICNYYKIKIIEDASHAFGSIYKGNKIGNCKFSDICVFSFHPVKPFTSGEGGMATTNNKKYFYNMQLYANHGIQKKSKYKKWYYEQKVLGYNYRLSEIHSALGLSQILKVDKFIKKRNLIASRYDKSFKNLPLQLPKINTDCRSSYHLYVIRIDYKNLKKGVTYNTIFNEFLKYKININLHYLPIFSHPYYKNKIKYKNLNKSILYSKSAYSIPVYYMMSYKQQNKVIKVIKNIIKKYIKNS